MPNVATIEAVTGPNRKVNITLAQVDELTFRFGKNILEVTEKGNMSQYDLAQVSSIKTTSENGQYLIEVKSEDKSEKDQHVGEVKQTNVGPVEIGGQETKSPLPPKSDFPPKK